LGPSHNLGACAPPQPQRGTAAEEYTHLSYSWFIEARL